MKLVIKVVFIYVSVIAAFLSQTFAGEQDDARHIGPGLELYNPNPFSGATNLVVTLEKEEWYGQKEAIPYIWPWDNDLNQTAQQMVGVVYVLQSEGMTNGEIDGFLRWYKEINRGRR